MRNTRPGSSGDMLVPHNKPLRLPVQFTANLLETAARCRLTAIVRCRCFPPFWLETAVRILHLMHTGPARGPFFARGDDPQVSNPVGTFLFSDVSFMPAASAMVSASAAKSFWMYS